ncbi:hypothetical protein WJX72_007967 [[Myrmecia] bisecta]|uniref:protein-tyrosine-phosphatase n=1 Tax=[Myrmecia] bisecta TaxID=41462 RepID=A0AAW1Q3V5_9CHLO
MEVKTATPERIFRVFTACPNDTRTLIVDVRHAKEYKKLHILSAYNVRLAANGKTLLDYSKNTYDFSWSADCWWDKHVIVYGDEKLRKDHPVVAFLSQDNHAKSLHIYKEGFEAFSKRYAVVCTASTKATALRRYPSEIIPGLLYLGDWSHAENTDRLNEINVKRILTIHNHPENLKVPSKINHRKYELADVDTQDISPFFSPSYDFIEEARAANEAVLVHCGAGVSRSAALCIAYLMRRFQWSAAKARSFCHERRSLVAPNDGFWRSLCALEGQLGIANRSNPNEGGGRGVDAPVALAQDAAGEKVTVTFVPAGRGASTAQPSSSKAEEAAGAGAGQAARDGSQAAAGSNREAAAVAGNDRDKDRRRSEREAAPDRHRDTERDRARRGDADANGRPDTSDRRRSDADDSGRRRDRGDRDKDRKRDRGDERPDQRSSSADYERDRKKPKAGDNGASNRGGELQPSTPPPAVVLQASKEGRVVGQFEISLAKANQRCVFGRTPGCDVQLEHASISRQHAQLTTDAAGLLYLTDLGSAHGTNVDGVWIRPKAPRQLAKGAVFKFGGSTREYKVLAVPRDASSQQLPAQATD